MRQINETLTTNATTSLPIVVKEVDETRSASRSMQIDYHKVDLVNETETNNVTIMNV